MKYVSWLFWGLVGALGALFIAHVTVTLRTPKVTPVFQTIPVPAEMKN